MFAFCLQTTHRHILRSQEGFTAPVHAAEQVQVLISFPNLCRQHHLSLQLLFLRTRDLNTFPVQQTKSLPLPKLGDAGFSQVPKSYMPNSPQLV